MLLSSNAWAIDSNDLITVVTLLNVLNGGQTQSQSYNNNSSNPNTYSYNSSGSNQQYLNNLNNNNGYYNNSNYSNYNNGYNNNSNYNTYQNNPNAVYYSNNGSSNTNGYSYNSQNGYSQYNQNGSYNNNGVVVQQGIPVNQVTYTNPTPVYNNPTPNIDQNQNVPGHYVTKIKKVWIPETTEKKWVEPKYSQIWNQYTQSYKNQKVSDGYWKEYYIPGHYIEKEVQEFVPDRWRTLSNN